MHFPSRIWAAPLAAAIAIPAAAQADTARTTADLSLRTGPSTSYERVAVIPEGSAVEMTQCTPDFDWCRVAWGGYNGWSSANYLVKAQTDPPDLPPAPYDPQADAQAQYDQQPYRGRDPVADIGAQLAIPVIDFFGQLAAGEEEPRLRFGMGDETWREERLGASEVCFYADYDYQGERLCTDAGSADSGLRDAWNDRISSIRVGSNARIQVCEHYDYGGNCRIIGSDVDSLGGGWNDMISSYRSPGAAAEPDDDYAGGARPGQVCFYEDYNYSGSRRCVWAGSPTANLGQDWNDSVSSIRVGANTRIQLCEHYDAGGQCQVIDSDVAQLDGGWNDRISSYGAPQTTPGGGPDVGAIGANEVCFYEHTNYEGSRFCAEATGGNASLGAPWNDTISSIRIGQSANVEVCQDYDYAGSCTSVSGNMATLSGGWNDAISSFRSN